MPTDLERELDKCGLSDQYTKRDLRDFSGNLYWLIEFDPVGYAIYHPVAKVFSEFSETAPSPYAGYDSIVYGGPSFYYYQTSTEYVNIKTGESTSKNLLVAENLSDSSTDALTATYNSFVDYEVDDAVAPTAADMSYLIPNAYYFQKLNSFGINVRGTCGQLAASILLSYYANYVNVNFVPTEYITPRSGTTTNYQSWSAMPALSNNLHLELIDITEELGLSLGTTGTSIKTILSTYYYDHSIGGVSQQVLTSPFFVDTQMRNIINGNNPMLMFGNLTLPGGGRGNHVVVCYGYRILSNVTYYRVHMGYSGCTDIELANLWSQNVFGQIYSISYSGLHVHSGNFIVNGTAHCGCGAVTV